jgi:beta-glucosidase
MAREIKFPDGFFWGSATSAYQVEGGIDNNDWAEAARQGKVPPAGRACDHYNLYEKDFDIAKALGQNAYHFSIEWARIEPEEGKFDETEIEHYRKVLKALQERGIEPFVTLWHFTLPVWFAHMGGFENKKAPFYFSRYCEYVVKNLGQGSGTPKFWITINEPMVFADLGYLKGNWLPFKKWHYPLSLFRYFKVIKNMATSHNISYQKIKSIRPDGLVGIATHNVNFESNHNPFNYLLAKFLIWLQNHRFLRKIEDRQDFIGLNYYFYKKFGDNNVHDKSDMGWSIYPKGIYNVLMELKRYHKPVYVTENGIADAKDVKRAKFIKEHLYWVKRAIDDRIDIRGYFYWSLLDNYEWADGFEPKFGLVEVDYETMERRIRPSAYEYKKICENNSLI